jgi:hypothetical protein
MIAEFSDDRSAQIKSLTRCNGPSRSKPPPLASRINGQTKVPGWAAVGVIVGILVLIAAPTLMLIGP